MHHEPHSTKQREDFVAWASETDPATLVDTVAGRLGLHGAEATPLEPLCARVQCPVLVVHGTDDKVHPAAIGGSLVLMDGVGHAPPAREPVRVNHLIGELADRVFPRPVTTTWTRARDRGGQVEHARATRRGRSTTSCTRTPSSRGSRSRG
ncbi:hypothetical protein L615_003300000220 [Nocardioides sp. J9]|nr:hypothetical protein L615_003300000220 [Nocardioides sp. J9]